MVYTQLLEPRWKVRDSFSSGKEGFKRSHCELLLNLPGICRAFVCKRRGMQQYAGPGKVLKGITCFKSDYVVVFLDNRNDVTLDLMSDRREINFPIFLKNGNIIRIINGFRMPYSTSVCDTHKEL